MIDIKPTKGFFFGETTPWEEVGPGLKRQIMGYDKHIMLVKVEFGEGAIGIMHKHCLLYTSPSPRDATLSRMPSSA